MIMNPGAIFNFIKPVTNQPNIEHLSVKVVEVLSKHAGLWITNDKQIMYSQATHIKFTCPMRFDAFPLDTQVGSHSTKDPVQSK